MKTLGSITLSARERGLEALLAGGHAVIVHGYQRTTFDTDLVIRRSARAAWLDFMLGQGFEMYHEGPAFLQFNPPPGERLVVDLMTTGEETFQQFLEESLPNPHDPGSPRVVSLRHLLAMKCHAIRHGHAGRIGKDTDDVISLFTINKLNPNQSPWRELILKYGTEELLQQLRQILEK